MPRLLQYEGISATSRTIRFLTWAQYKAGQDKRGTSHSAMEHDDGRVTQAWHNPNGVATIENFEFGHTPGTIVRAYNIPSISQMQWDYAEAYILSQVDKDYDFRGVLRFITRHDPQDFNPDTFKISDYDPQKWFCSCLFFAALMQAECKLLERIPPWRVSPNLINLSPLIVPDEILIVGPQKTVPQASSLRSPQSPRSFLHARRSAPAGVGRASLPRERVSSGVGRGCHSLRSLLLSTEASLPLVESLPRERVSFDPRCQEAFA